MPITVIATTGLAYWGKFNPYAHEEGMTLPTSGAFTPANGRKWLVEFWLLEGKWVGVAIPFGIVLFVLFYFDANVSVRRYLSTSQVPTDKTVLDGARFRVPSEETTSVSLGFLPSGHHNLHFRSSRNPSTERFDPTSTSSY
jgi:hypothetical protein